MRVLHAKRDEIPEDAVYIGRPSKWGNPFIIGPDGSRAEVIAKYKKHLYRSKHLMDKLPELKGRSLYCWCAPKPCHGDVIMEAVEEL